MPLPVDPAKAVLRHVVRAMGAAFSGTGNDAPLGGPVTAVRFFAGDAPPLAAWDAHHNSRGCDEGFAWVRLARRYRSRDFPAPVVDPSLCGLPRVIAVEVGIARCAVVAEEPDWDDYDREAGVSLDDAYRLETALCWAGTEAVRCDEALQVALDAILPSGPDGGVVAWTGMLYAQL